MRAPQVQIRGSASKDVVSYYTSRSICGRTFSAGRRVDDLSVFFPHVHFIVRGIVKPLVMIAAPARLEDTRSVKKFGPAASISSSKAWSWMKTSFLGRN
jgi:hypothetical protein